MTHRESRPQTAAAAQPERIGKYEIVRSLGKGAMGVVYVAHDPLLDREVALKVMLPQIADDPEQKHRFEREARAVARMTHPNVVTVFDLGYHSDGSPYIAMELLRGRDLLQTLRDDTPLGLERKLSIIQQVLAAVGHAHQAGIVHRDIKPANTFLNNDGVVKIMDFGVARFTAASMTATGIVVGTANYMSPEQVNGARVDGRADLFSIGCMLYELALGRRPFESETLMSTLWKIVHQEVLEPPSGEELGGLVPILRRALAKRPEDRYQTAAEFAADLRQYAVASEQPVERAPAAHAPRGLPADAGATLDILRPAVPPATRAPADPTPLFGLMREIQAGARSGHLHFTHGREHRSLRILRGRIVHGMSDVPGQHLGDVMVRYGLLSQADLQTALAAVLRERRRLGAVLVERSLLSAERLGQAVGIHIREVLSDVTGPADGAFTFEELPHHALPEGEAVPTLSVAEMILETARRIQSPEVVRRVLGDLNRVLSNSSHPTLSSQELALTPTEGFLLSRIDGKTAARELFGLIPLPPEDVERSLFALLCTGMLDYEGGGAAARSVGSAARAEPPRAPVREPGSSVAYLGKLQRAAQAAEERTAAAAREVAERAARQNQAEELRRRANQSRREAILAASEGIEERSHFEVLGLDRDCSIRQVESAFQRLALQFRPDLPLPQSLSDLQDKRAAIYARLIEAHEVLGDATRRSQYQAGLDARQLRPPAPPPPPQAASLNVEGPLYGEGVALAIRKAQKLLSENAVWDAIQLLESVIPKAEGRSRFRAQVILARAYLRNPKWVKRAEELLYSVVREAPEHAEAYVVLGNIYRLGQLRARAEAMYRRALVLQPALAEALEGLAGISQTKPDAPAAGSLIKKVLKR